MSPDAPTAPFSSVLAPFMEAFLQEKRACGCTYHEPARLLRHLDAFVGQQGVTTPELPRSLVRTWVAKHAHESATTQQHRITVARHFARFLVRRGYAAYVPETPLAPRTRSRFLPRLLTDDEIRQLFQAVDALAPTARAPLRHLIMPEVFRLLYGCGFRLGEVLHLRVRDVDLQRGVITVRHGKGDKDRLVPPAVSLVKRLHTYAARFDTRSPGAFFFPAPSGGPYSLRTVYSVFRTLLLRCGIPHAGRGKGPRIHDYRHVFAVHTLRRWYRDGADLDAKLPLLATYLGHQHLSGTQRYLHLTADLFPEITARVDPAFGDVIPRRIEP